MPKFHIISYLKYLEQENIKDFEISHFTLIREPTG